MRATYICLVILLFVVQSCKPKNQEVEHPYTNALISESSPYLLQHAHNPVNWYPWGQEALDKAQQEQKLMIVSIGYAACHWCHIMEEESFNNDSIARLMNTNFINIKVDKEERPDIDQIYLEAVELMTGSGGWPVNCVTLPDGRPIFGGTYFEKEDWERALTQILQVYAEQPENVIAYADKLTQGIKNSQLVEASSTALDLKEVSIAPYIKTWNSYLDFVNGGQQTANKFPLPNNLQFQLRYAHQNSNDSLWNYVNTTLTKMAYGGIYDQIGGGFSRYAVDEQWHVPHFEKMLYDNAQLVSIYSEAYTATKNPLFKKVVEETLDFVSADLSSNSGAFYSSRGADSSTKDGTLEEGAYYMWTEEELKNLLADEFDLFSAYFNVDEQNIVDNSSYVLWRSSSDEVFATAQHMDISELKSKIENWKDILSSARQRRAKPELDDKVLTSWNAQMLLGYLDAYKALGNQEYLERAKSSASFIESNLLREDGGLFHTYKNGKSSINGYLEDYALVIRAFIEMYQVSFDEAWLTKAKNLTEYTKAHFKDDTTQLFYFTSNIDSQLIVRNIEVTDGVVPSSNSLMALNLFYLGQYLLDMDYINQSKQMLENVMPQIEHAPSNYSNWLLLLNNFTDPFYEVALSGKEAMEKATEIHRTYVPNVLLAGAFEDSDLPIMKNKYMDGNTFIYICVNGTCKQPVSAVEEALQKIKQ